MKTAAEHLADELALAEDLQESEEVYLHLVIRIANLEKHAQKAPFMLLAALEEVLANPERCGAGAELVAYATERLPIATAQVELGKIKEAHLALAGCVASVQEAVVAGAENIARIRALLHDLDQGGA
jgi:hypothetical protein